MVIQRIQSVYLLLACLLSVGVGLFVPVVCDGSACHSALSLWQPLLPFIVISLVTAALQLVDIFLFSNLKLQMKVATMSSIMVWATAFVWGFMMAFRLDAPLTACWTWPAVCLVASFVLTLLAWAAMKKDYKKLKSYDRLW